MPDGETADFVLVHAYHNGLALLADIPGRGLCIPSGHIEPGETVLEAAVRETYEETGGHIDTAGLTYLGYHRLTRPTGHAPECKIGAAFLAEVTAFAPIPAGSESAGIVLVSPDEVAERYFYWDELMAALFAYVDRMRGK